MRAIHAVNRLAIAASLAAGLVTCALAQSPAPDRSLTGKLPSSSRCLADCEVMEAKCEALEREFPTCGAADVCIEEKQSCVARCKLTAQLDDNGDRTAC